MNTTISNYKRAINLYGKETADKKTISKVIDKLNKQEQIKEKFNTFLTTNNGKKFVSLLHREDIRVLANRLGCSYILFTPSIT